MKANKGLLFSFILLLFINNTIFPDDFSEEYDSAKTDMSANLISSYFTSNTEYNATINEYNRFVLDHSQNAYKFQLVSTMIIFIVVVILVFLGITTSIVQIFTPALLKNNIPQSHIDAELKGFLKFSFESSVIGLFLLVISFAFFLIYVIHIYPIK